MAKGKKTAEGQNQELINLLKDVEKLAKEGFNQKEIAKKLGYKTTFTLNNRLVKASQITGHPVPPFKLGRKSKKVKKLIETVEIKRRGKGSAYGVNIPQEPLERAKMQPGDKLKVSVRGKSITLTKIS
ncbi:MAG: hypothetical protein OEZ59_10170 [Deltaproteobacteria bacterium]|nr:hypothetical protein [Deltaproteobacteria bacterium]